MHVGCFIHDLVAIVRHSFGWVGLKSEPQTQLLIRSVIHSDSLLLLYTLSSPHHITPHRTQNRRENEENARAFQYLAFYVIPIVKKRLAPKKHWIL